MNKVTVKSVYKGIISSKINVKNNLKFKCVKNIPKQKKECV